MNEHGICKNVWYLSIWPYSWALCVFLASSKSGAASQQTIILLLLNLRCWRWRPPRNWSWWENFRFFSSTPPPHPPPPPPLPGCCCGDLKHSSSYGGQDDDATTRADLELHASSSDTIEAFNANNSIKTVVLEARSKLWQRRGIQLFLCLARYRFSLSLRCCYNSERKISELSGVKSVASWRPKPVQEDLVHEARPFCLRPAEEEASHHDGENANKQTTTVCKPPADERSWPNLDFARRRQNQELDEEVSAQQLQRKAQEQQWQPKNAKFSPRESCGVLLRWRENSLQRWHSWWRTSSLWNLVAVIPCSSSLLLLSSECCCNSA